jgi:hypothetical protein
MVKPNLSSPAFPFTATSLTATFFDLSNRNLVCTGTPETPGAYAYLKQAFLSRYTSTAIANCFRFIDHPDLGDRHPLTLFSDMQALLPEDANILFNAHYLRRLPESMQKALAGKDELPPHEVSEAAAFLPRPQLATSVPTHLSTPLPPSLTIA